MTGRGFAASAAAAVPGAAAVLLVAAAAPVSAQPLAAVGVAAALLAALPPLRWLQVGVQLVVAALAVPAAVGGGLTLHLAAAVGMLVLAHLLAMDAAEVVAVAGRAWPTGLRAWGVTVAPLLVAGAVGGAVALLVAGLPLPPSLALAVMGPVAAVAAAVLVLRPLPPPSSRPLTRPAAGPLRDGGRG